MVWWCGDPESGTAEAQFPAVWFATERRVRSPVKLIVHDDQGILIIRQKGVLFQGEHTRLVMVRVISATMVRQTPPWVIYGLADVFLLILASALWLFSWPVGVMFLAFLVAFNVLGLFIGFSTPWIRIEFENDRGEIAIGFIANAEERGWKGIRGGTAELQSILAKTQSLPIP